MEYLIGLILALAGLLVVTNKKKNSAEAQNILVSTKEKDLQLLKESVILDTSTKQIKESEENLSKEESNEKANSDSNVIDFWRKRSGK